MTLTTFLSDEFDANMDTGSYGDIVIPEGSRNATLSHYAGRILKRYGNTEEAHKIAMDTVREWALLMLRLGGVTYDIEGVENYPKDRVCVVMPNHQSDWDIPLILAALPEPFCIIAKKEIKKIPIVNTWMEYAGFVFIDRSDARKSVQALKEAGQQIELGRTVGVFPEGTRSKSAEIGEFKSGGIRIAVKHKVPILPVAIDGTYKIMEANGGKWIKPQHVKLTVLPPVETENTDKAREKTLGSDLRELIGETLAKMRDGGQQLQETEK